jgi:hypothetical protein
VGNNALQHLNFKKKKKKWFIANVTAIALTMMTTSRPRCGRPLTCRSPDRKEQMLRRLMLTKMDSARQIQAFFKRLIRGK